MEDIAKNKFIDQLMGEMTLEEKIGQCLVLGYTGTVITPEILWRIKNYHPAGIRAGFYWRMRTAKHDPGCTPPEFAHMTERTAFGTIKDYIPGYPIPHCTNEEFCTFLNRLKQEALSSGKNIPMHITFDFEGDQSGDYYRGGAHHFPSCMGLAQSKDPKMAYDVAWAIGTQLAPLGFSWIHSPVLDVNTNPMNPEIGVRSYGEDAETVIKYALESLRGFQDTGIITTGKHFPGRGASTSDAHAGLPVINLSLSELKEHLQPYQQLIDAGLPSIMTAHSVYPKIDASGLPATLSKTILTDLLKGDMGFKNVITTDEMSMGGILAKFELADACIQALNAGADLLLMRDEGAIIHEVFPALVDAVKNKKLPLSRIEDANRRVLSVKYDYGFFKENSSYLLKDESKASDGINHPKVHQICQDAANKAATILRDEDSILPLNVNAKVLLIEQVNPMHANINTQHCHPSIFWEKLLEHSENVGSIETHMVYSDEDKQRILARYDQADVIIITNYYGRQHLKGNSFVKEVASWGKPTIVVTNSPYPFTVMPEYNNVIVTYGCSTESLKAASMLIYGVKS
ncbi:MAG: glycoside hydrolase family 3 N-terminal domain-containing protein [Prolixibacteraceae bacterium]